MQKSVPRQLFEARQTPDSLVGVAGKRALTDFTSRISKEIWLALRFIIECDYFTGRVIEADGDSTF
ncbi:MAG TPA: hypothetical protein VFY60_04425 [Pyrinomonadaceae bacterium]|nr:hypothetical protein [Pyrinomonadaceae bacterium]